MIEIIQSTTPSFLVSLLRQICSVKGVKAEFRRAKTSFIPSSLYLLPFPLTPDTAREDEWEKEKIGKISCSYVHICFCFTLLSHPEVILRCGLPALHVIRMLVLQNLPVSMKLSPSPLRLAFVAGDNLPSPPPSSSPPPFPCMTSVIN